MKLVTGQTATAAPGDFAGYGRAWRLTSTVDGSTGTVTDELEVTLLYIQPSWAFFNAATDSGCPEIHKPSTAPTSASGMLAMIKTDKVTDL